MSSLICSDPDTGIHASALGNTPEPKKKRGRPTKIESEARRQAANARGEPYPATKSNTAQGFSYSIPMVQAPVMVGAAVGSHTAGLEVQPLTSGASTNGERKRARVDLEDRLTAESITNEGSYPHKNEHLPEVQSSAASKPDLRLSAEVGAVTPAAQPPRTDRGMNGSVLDGSSQRHSSYVQRTETTSGD